MSPDALTAVAAALACLNIVAALHYERRLRRVEARKRADRRRAGRALADLAARVTLCEMRLDALDRRARGLDAPPRPADGAGP